MAVTQYIGSRYVPLFADPIEWSDQNTYEPLTIVLHEGNSFTSKQAVPRGIDLSNEDYWAETGNYNAQVESYRRETQRVSDALDTIEEQIADIETDVGEGTEYIHVLHAGLDPDISDSTPFYLFSIPRTVTPKVYPLNGARQNRDTIPDNVNGVFINGALPSPLISDGQIVGTSAGTSWWYFTGLKNGVPTAQPFPGTDKPSAEDLLAMGWTFGIGTYEVVLQNYLQPSYDDFEGMPHYDTMNLHGPRAALGWDEKRWYVYASDGRQLISHGITQDELKQIAYKYRIPNFVNMDGGASVQLYTAQPVDVWTLTSDSKGTAENNIYNYRRRVNSLIAFEF